MEWMPVVTYVVEEGKDESRKGEGSLIDLVGIIILWVGYVW